MRYLVTMLAAIALLALALVSGCGLISGLGDDSSSSDSAADISTDASFDDTSFLSNDNNAFLSDTGSATTTEDSNLDPENTLEIQLKDGTVVIELLADVAPLHVARLKELTRQGFYNGIKFHRVIDIQID